MDMHPRDRADSFRELVPTPQPGSLEEAQALAEIDTRRHEETNPPTRRRRAKALRSFWGERDHALGR